MCDSEDEYVAYDNANKRKRSPIIHPNELHKEFAEESIFNDDQFKHLLLVEKIGNLVSKTDELQKERVQVMDKINDIDEKLQRIYEEISLSLRKSLPHKTLCFDSGNKKRKTTYCGFMNHLGLLFKKWLECIVFYDTLKSPALCNEVSVKVLTRKSNPTHDFVFNDEFDIIFEDDDHLNKIWRSVREKFEIFRESTVFVTSIRDADNPDRTGEYDDWCIDYADNGPNYFKSANRFLSYYMQDIYDQIPNNLEIEDTTDSFDGRPSGRIIIHWLVIKRRMESKQLCVSEK